MRRGFTLLELSIVLALIGVILGGGLVVFTASVQTAQFNATVARMDALNTALLNYRVAFNRIPCPANLTLIPTSADYGEEAGWDSGSSITTATGACTGAGMLPQANFSGAATDGDTVAEGAVPTRALRLPDSYMYDGWGRRFRYAVDVTMTATNAFVTTPILPSICAPTGISVTDASDIAGSRTAIGIYAIVSHGSNGHGGYTSNGVPVNAGSVNADELTNCHCSSSTTPTTYAPNYVQKLPTVDPANALDNFDDIASFRTLMQMQTQATNETVGKCKYFAVAGGSGTTNVYLYIWKNGILVALPAPAVGATGGLYGAAAGSNSVEFSYDDSYLITMANETSGSYAHGGNIIGIVYSVSPYGLTWQKDMLFSNYPYNHMAVSPYGNAFSYSIDTNSNPWGSLNEWTGAAPFSSSPPYYIPNIDPTMDYAPDSNLYTVQGNNLNIYSGVGLNRLFSFNISSALGGGGPNTLSVHPSGNYVAFSSQYGSTATTGAGTSQPTASGTTPVIMKNPEGSYTWISNGQNNPSIDQLSVLWSPDGNYLAEGGDRYGGLRIYYFSSVVPESLTQLINTGCSGSGTQFLSWSSDSQYLAFGSLNKNVCIIKRSGSLASATFSAFTPAGATLPGNLLGLAFSH